jgi:hypothetical protein
MKFAGRKANVEETKNIKKILLGNLKGIYPFEHPVVDGRINIKNDIT